MFRKEREGVWLGNKLEVQCAYVMGGAVFWDWKSFAPSQKTGRIKEDVEE